MQYKLKIQFDAIREVGDWLSRHPSPDPVRAAKATELASIHNATGAWLSQQRDGLLAVRQATMEKAQLRREIHTEARDLANLARVASAAAVGVDARLRLPRQGANEPAFVSGMRQVIAAAESNRELLLAHGMEPEMLAAMSGLVDLFEAAQKRWNKGRDDHIAASTQLKELAREGRKLLRHLDALERRRLRGQPDLIATWDAARNVPYRARPIEEEQANQPAA